MNDTTLKAKTLSAARQLPTLPHIMVHLLEACNKEEGSMLDLARIIKKDPALTHKILKTVNSAYYGLPNKPSTIEQAVTILGTSAIKNIAICASVHQVFRGLARQKGFNLKTFWWHSLKCAYLAKCLAERLAYPSPDEAFVAGLLHDIGKLVIWVTAPAAYQQLVLAHSDAPAKMLAGERQLGGSHCEFGAELINAWNFQSFMADAVLYHHAPPEHLLTAAPLAQIVYAANLLAQHIESARIRGLEVTEHLLGVKRQESEVFLESADANLQEVSETLGIRIAAPSSAPQPVDQDSSRSASKLKNTIEDYAMLVGAVENLLEANDEAQIFEHILLNLQILINVESIFFFLYDPERDGLRGKAAVDHPQYPLIENLLLSMQDDGSLIVSALRSGRTCDSFQSKRTVSLPRVETQLTRLMDKEGLLCLPLIHDRTPLGVIVVVLDAYEYDIISQQKRLLRLMTKQAALALQALRLKARQIEKIQSERLNASRSLARKVVHEVSNPLAIMKNYLKILEQKMDDLNVAGEEVQILNEEIDRIVRLIKPLSSFSDSRTPALKSVDVNRMLVDLDKIMRESLARQSQIELRLDLEPGLPRAIADQDGLKQILINLIKNAMEAMPKGGAIDLQTRRVTDAGSQVSQAVASGMDGHVEIVVSDQGPGLPRNVRERLFDPFLTTKKAHSGLGLSIVYKLVQSFGGRIRCNNLPERGARFRIELPLAHGEPGLNRS